MLWLILLRFSPPRQGATVDWVTARLTPRPSLRSLLVLCAGLVSGWRLSGWHILMKHGVFQQRSIKPRRNTGVLQPAALLGESCLAAGCNLGSEFSLVKWNEAWGGCPDVRLLHVVEHRARLGLEMFPQLKKRPISIFSKLEQKLQIFPRWHLIYIKKKL